MSNNETDLLEINFQKMCKELNNLDVDDKINIQENYHHTQPSGAYGFQNSASNYKPFENAWNIIPNQNNFSQGLTGRPIVSHRVSNDQTYAPSNITSLQTWSIPKQYGNWNLVNVNYDNLNQQVVNTNCTIPPNPSALAPYAAKSFQPKKNTNYGFNNRKFGKFTVKTQPETADIESIEVSLDKLGIGPKNETKSNFLIIISLFRRLSIYTMELSKERISINIGENNAIENYHLPTVISNIPNHIRTIRQSIGYELHEIMHLIDSTKINYNRVHEKVYRQKMQKDIEELGQYEIMKIRTKNGEILLTNELISTLQNTIKDLIECVRFYAVYLMVLKFKMSKEKSEEIDDKIAIPEPNVEVPTARSPTERRSLNRSFGF